MLNSSHVATLALVAFGGIVGASAPAQAADVERFGLVDERFEQAGQYKNPYVELTATATLTEPDGRTTRTVPLFWDGGRAWRFRFSPDLVGKWKWQVKSGDGGLDGHSGEFTVVDSAGHGSIRPMPAAPHHFERQDGSPFWFMGDTAWALYTDNELERHNADAAREFIDARAAQGFNVLHSMLLAESGWGNSGGPPFDDIAAEAINPGYWQEVDRRLAHVNSRGMIAGLAIAWGDKRKVEPYAWRRFPSVEARKRYARYIAARYSAYDVYFIVSGEWHGEIRTRGASEDEVRREFIEIGDALHAADPHDRMMAIHPMTAHGSVREFVGTDWFTFGDYQQNYRELHERVLISRAGNAPVVNAEYGYYLRDADADGLVDKNNSINIAEIRHASWDIAMAGGYFVTGFGTTYFGGNRDPGAFYLAAKKNDIWEEQIQHLPELFTSLAWWKLRPLDDDVICATPRGKDRTGRRADAERSPTLTIPPVVTYWMLGDPGETYLAYVRGTTEALSLRVEAGAYTAERFDPRTGERQSLGKKVEVADVYRFDPPDKQDWVVLLRRAR